MILRTWKIDRVGYRFRQVRHFLALTIVSAVGTALMILAGRPEIFAPAMVFRCWGSRRLTKCLHLSAPLMNLPPLVWLVEHISALAILRFPVKLLFFSVVALAVLAASGLQDFGQGKARMGIAMAFSLTLLACGIFLQMRQSQLFLPFETDFTFDWQRLKGQQMLVMAWCTCYRIAFGAIYQLLAKARVGKLLRQAFSFGYAPQRRTGQAS